MPSPPAPPVRVAVYRTYWRRVAPAADWSRCDVAPVAAVNAPPVTSAQALLLALSSSFTTHEPASTAVTWRCAVQPVVVAAESFFDEPAAADLGHYALLAPLTFISVFGYRAQLAMFQTNNISIADAKIVHVDQELKFLVPIRAGDRLYCDVHVHSTRTSFGADIIVNKSIVTNHRGEVVQESFTTLAGRTGEDGEEGGFNDGTA